MRLYVVALALALAVVSPFALAKGGGSHGSYSTGTHGKAAGVERDAHGHIKRSQEAKDQFKKSHPCPSTGKSGACPGYVIDHVVPLKRGQYTEAAALWSVSTSTRQRNELRSQSRSRRRTR